MDDADILKHIERLVQEENELRAHGTQAEESHQRLRAVQEHLDQCWDLLRQRRAKAEFGQDPDTAQVRDAKTVETYKG